MFYLAWAFIVSVYVSSEKWSRYDLRATPAMKLTVTDFYLHHLFTSELSSITCDKSCEFVLKVNWILFASSDPLNLKNWVANYNFSLESDLTHVSLPNLVIFYRHPLYLVPWWVDLRNSIRWYWQRGVFVCIPLNISRSTLWHIFYPKRATTDKARLANQGAQQTIINIKLVPEHIGV